jgi:hypothetical protein
MPQCLFLLLYSTVIVRMPFCKVVSLFFKCCWSFQHVQTCLLELLVDVAIHFQIRLPSIKERTCSKQNVFSPFEYLSQIILKVGCCKVVVVQGHSCIQIMQVRQMALSLFDEQYSAEIVLSPMLKL